MKKGFLPVFLALALCAGLCVPAFGAVQIEPEAYYFDFETGLAAREKTVSLYGWDGEPRVLDKLFCTREVDAKVVREGDWQYSYAISEKVSRSWRRWIYDLDLDGGILIEGADPENDLISFFAYSDPDGDGVYDMLLFDWGDDYDRDAQEHSPPTVISLAETGTIYDDYGGSRYRNVCKVLGDDALANDFFTDTAPAPSIRLSARFLTELLGPNTVIDLEGAGIGRYSFFLTGKETGGSAAGPAGPGFTDVPEWEYYAEPVKWAVENEITKGTTDTTFSPDDTCTEGEILTFLWRAAGYPESAAQAPIALTGDEWYAGAIRWAAEKGMIGQGFDPGTLCTRSNAVKYIWQASGKPGAGDSGFTDVPAGADYAAAVAWAVEDGVTKGTTDTTFSPAETCTRGQIVTFLHRAMG